MHIRLHDFSFNIPKHLWGRTHRALPRPLPALSRASPSIRLLPQISGHSRPLFAPSILYLCPLFRLHPKFVPLKIKLYTGIHVCVGRYQKNYVIFLRPWLSY